MITALGTLWLGLDVLLIGYLTWSLGRWTRWSVTDPVASLLAALCVGISLPVIISALLGFAGLLEPRLITTGLVVLSLLVWLRGCSGAVVGRRIWIRFRRLTINRGPLWRVLFLSIGVILAALAVASAFATILVVDDLAYRLPRIGIWLQENSLAHFPTSNERMNYMPIGSELFGLWLCAHYPVAFPLAGWIGYTGAVLLTLATVAWGRALDLRPIIRIAAGALVLLTPIVVSQSTTAQGDLLTAGLLHAGLYFLWRSFRTRRFSWLPGFAVALAVFCKGTVFYWGPGLVAFALFTARALVVPRTLLFRQGAAIVALVFVLSLPSWVQNYWSYAHPFGPKEEVARFREGADGHASFLQRIRYNGGAWLLQNFQPAANFPAFSEEAALVGQRLIRPILSAESRGGNLVSLSRTHFLEGALKTLEIRMETLSFGLLPVGLGSLGVLIATVHAFRLRRCTVGLAVAASLMLFAGGVVLLVAWQPFAYRFFVLVLPFAWVIGLRWCRVGAVAVGLLISAQAVIAANVFANDARSGYSATFGRRETANYWLLGAHRELLLAIDDRARSLGISLPDHPNQAVVASFLRTGAAIRVQFFPLRELNSTALRSTMDRFEFDVVIVPVDAVTSPDQMRGLRRIDANSLRFVGGEMYFRLLEVDSPPDKEDVPAKAAP